MVHFCFDHNIKVFPMPPHLTHQLQPLDVGVFRSYKHWHQQVLHRSKTINTIATHAASIQRFNWNNVSTPRLNLSTIQRYHAYVQLRLATSVDSHMPLTPSVTYVYEKARKADKTLALNGITATAEMTKIKEKQAKRSSLQQQTTIVARYGPLSDGDARIRVARDEYNRQAAQEEEAQRVRNKEVRDEAGYIRRWLRKVRFNVRISITEAKIRDIRGLWAKGDKRAHLNCNEWMCASYRILRELHNRGVGQSKAIMWPEYYDREIVKEAAELVVMEANKRAICRQTLSLEADGIEMR
ncbi:DDE superfamily endonuclease [Hirsutella rhossiliensis]